MTDPSTVSADVPRGAPAETDSPDDLGPEPGRGVDVALDPGPVAPPAPVETHRRASTERGRRAVTGVLVVLLLATTGTAVYLHRTSQAWQERAEEYLAAGQDVGARLAQRQAELAGVEAELEAVRAQLTTAQDRIIELANEKARAADDREAQRQVADYQERVSVAAGQVAFALDQCVQGQNQLIAFLETQIEDAGSDGPPTPGQDAATSPNQQAIDQVHELCEGAREANIALQSELAR